MVGQKAIQLHGIGWERNAGRAPRERQIVELELSRSSWPRVNFPAMFFSMFTRTYRHLDRRQLASSETWRKGARVRGLAHFSRRRAAWKMAGHIPARQGPLPFTLQRDC